MCLGKNLERKRENLPKTSPKLPKFTLFFYYYLILGGFGGIYDENLTLQIPVAAG